MHTHATQQGGSSVDATMGAPAKEHEQQEQQQEEEVMMVVDQTTTTTTASSSASASTGKGKGRGKAAAAEKEEDDDDDDGPGIPRNRITHGTTKLWHIPPELKGAGKPVKLGIDEVGGWFLVRCVSNQEGVE